MGYLGDFFQIAIADGFGVFEVFFAFLDGEIELFVHFFHVGDMLSDYGLLLLVFLALFFVVFDGFTNPDELWVDFIRQSAVIVIGQLLFHIIYL